MFIRKEVKKIGNHILKNPNKFIVLDNFIRNEDCSIRYCKAWNSTLLIERNENCFIFYLNFLESKFMKRIYNELVLYKIEKENIL